jgi:predicted dehydrogenase
MVGFNRRFAPHVVKAKEAFGRSEGAEVLYHDRERRGHSADHWTQDPHVGGGRIVGEGCHFVDLLRLLAASPITSCGLVRMDEGLGDTVSLSLKFADGSMGTVHYFANGNKSFPKERLEVFAEGKILQLDNFRVLRGYGFKGFRSMRLFRQNKGQKACANAFVQAIQKGSPSPIPFEEILEVSRVSIELARRRLSEPSSPLSDDTPSQEGADPEAVPAQVASRNSKPKRAHIAHGAG